jgi:hypothetical protein
MKMPEPDPGIGWRDTISMRFAESLVDAINRLVKTIGKRAKLALPTHFHMLRQSGTSYRRIELSWSPFDFIFQPVDDDFDRHQGERDPPYDSFVGGN